jgi:hypothetical protein
MTDCAPAFPGPDEIPLLRLRTPTDLLEVMPFLLGFHPTESLVVVMLHGRGCRVGATLRYDLPKVESGLLVHDIAAHAALHGDHAVVLVYTERPPTADSLPEWPLVSRATEALRRAAVRVADCLCVAGGRWWSYHCLDPQCCPADGRPLALAEAPSSPVAATAARAGLVALPDRAALVRTLDPVDGSARAGVERALAAAETAFVDTVATAGGISAWREAMRGLLARAGERVLAGDGAPDTHVLSDEESAEILVALSDVPIRDACWLRAERGRSGDNLALWSQLARRAVPPYDAAPLFLLGWAAWRRGDGALARIAAQRALASDAGYGAAQLLLDAMDSGVDPRRLPRLTAGRRPRRRAAGGGRR